MFCPNCGTQNPDTATTCTKCGFNLKGASAPKFKGTMLMMNQPPEGAPAAPAPSPGGEEDVKSKLKGTMIGVAPPAPGAAPSPGAQAPQYGGQQYGGQQGVDPMAGTMVAPNSPVGGQFPPPGGQPPPGGPMGGPPPGGPMGGPPPGGPMGGPPPGGPMGGPPPGGPMGGPPPGGPAPGGPMVAGAGAAMAGGGGGVKITPKNPTTELILHLVCGIGVFRMFSFLGELNQVRGKNDINPIMLFVPIMGLLMLLKLPTQIQETKQALGVPNATAPNLIMLLFLGPWVLAQELNEMARAQGVQVP